MDFVVKLSTISIVLKVLLNQRLELFFFMYIVMPIKTPIDSARVATCALVKF